MEEIVNIPEIGKAYLDLVSGVEKYECVAVSEGDCKMRRLTDNNIDWYTNLAWKLID